jgi:hypothetical protein
MKTLLGLGVVVLLPLAAAADDKEQAKGKETGFAVHSGYFEKNTSGLKGDASYLTFTDQKSFDQVFGTAATMKPQNFLPKNVFDSRLVVAVIKRGTAVTEYNVAKVTIDDGTVYVQYEAKAKDGGGTARYASPLIISFDKGRYTAVVFIENGKKVETLKLEKEK